MRHMKVQLNGEETQVKNTLTVAELLTQFKVPKDTVVVELNLEIVPKEALESTTLTEGDRIELVHFVGGG